MCFRAVHMSSHVMPPVMLASADHYVQVATSSVFFLPLSAYARCVMSSLIFPRLHISCCSNYSSPSLIPAAAQCAAENITAGNRCFPSASAFAFWYSLCDALSSTGLLRQTGPLAGYLRIHISNSCCDCAAVLGVLSAISYL